MRPFGKNFSRGFSVVEVLVTVAIFTVALVALARFMGGLMVAGSDAKSRALASALAQEKIEDLRQFAYPNAAPASPQTTTFGFNDIGDNTGGLKDGSNSYALFVGSGTVDAAKVIGSNVTYNLAWTVDDFYYPIGGGAPVAWTSASGQPEYADFKQVSVTVSYVDPSGVTQSVTLPAQINSVPPSSTGRSGAPEPERDEPAVGYTPQDAPDVIAIPIDIGGGKKRETSKPLPDVNQAGSVTWVSFGTVTFEELEGGGYQGLTKENFITINCPCQFASNQQAEAAVKKEAAYAVSRRLWNSDAHTLEDVVGDQVEKSVAETTLSQSDDAYFFCNTCCRNHHDPDGPNVPEESLCDPTATGENAYKRFNCYDMQRPLDGYTSAGIGYKHLHYDANHEVVTGLNTTYQEACRLKRIDGIWRVFSDWRLAGITTVESSDLEDGGDLQADYVQRVQDIVNGVVDDNGTVAPSSMTPLAGTSLNLYQGQAVQGLSRTIYVDEMTDDHLDYLDNYAYLNGVSSASATINRLEVVPFYEINSTLLNDWYPISVSDDSYGPNDPDPDHPDLDTDGDVATATSEPVDTIVDPVNDYYGTYSRGWITADNDVTLFTGTSSNVVADTKQSNTGITATQPIDPYDKTVTPSTISVSVLVSPRVAISGVLNNDAVSSSNKSTFKREVRVRYSGLINDPYFGLLHTGGGCEVTSVGSSLNYSCLVGQEDANDTGSSVTIGAWATGFTSTVTGNTLNGPFNVGRTGPTFYFDESP
jgi:type II secretory pathway pseudopilin PulG